ncbi:putative membrane-associated kinase regulator 6-like [Capsicum annuum]|nr:putative membrane-associated kinase regulator 6-like [Capsicum annuum]
MLFFQKNGDIAECVEAVEDRGVLAYIFATVPTDQLLDVTELTRNPKPFLTVDFEQGNQIFDYYQQRISNNQDPIIKYGQTQIRDGKEAYIKVPRFSSRVPNSFAPEILKEDTMDSTSCQEHPCQPLMSQELLHSSKLHILIDLQQLSTWNEDTYKGEIFSQGGGGKLADPFDFGGGICNPNGAVDPGLIYDMGKNDYSNYLCSLRYSKDRVYNDTTYKSDAKKSSSSAGIVCPKEVPSRLDMNLPSISIPNLKDSVTIKRTVTNVGNDNSIYKLVVKPPRNVAIKVTPDVLKFNAKRKKISFKVKITSTYQRSGKFTFGSLAWSDGKNFVRIPIVVRKKVDG